MAEETGIDIKAIEAEIGKLSKEDLFRQLVDIKAKQRIATKKYYNPETARKQRLRRAEVVKLMTAKAKELGIYDSIMEQAVEDADAALAEAEA